MEKNFVSSYECHYEGMENCRLTGSKGFRLGPNMMQATFYEECCPRFGNCPYYKNGQSKR